jgi:hypothetical protein
MTVDGTTNWRKASSSTSGGSNCVESAWADAAVGYRDSKQVGGPELWFPTSAARVFIARIAGVG